MDRRQTPEIPADLYDRLTEPQNTEHAIAAMEVFLRDGNEDTFEYAVALYVASARHRQEPIHKVVGALCALCDTVEGPRSETEVLLGPTRLHQLVFSGILRAFYGDVAVDRGIGASAQRKADAPQHTKSGTWPRKPVD
ncbi:MAG: hypothetical protein ABR585_11965 [Gemmatimonadaceae bacterium]